MNATPETISAGPGCESTQIEAIVTDADGVAAVTVAWSYLDDTGGEASGMLTMARRAGTDLWWVDFAPEIDPPLMGSLVHLVVTASDATGATVNGDYSQGLAVDRCSL